MRGKHNGPYFGGNVPSTGLAMFMVMSKTCGVVDLYGFGESKSGNEDSILPKRLNTTTTKPAATAPSEMTFTVSSANV